MTVPNVVVISPILVAISPRILVIIPCHLIVPIAQPELLSLNSMYNIR